VNNRFFTGPAIPQRLPFQMSVLGYTSPSVFATSHVFNIIPSEVFQYIRKKRMLLPLAWAIII